MAGLSQGGGVGPGPRQLDDRRRSRASTSGAWTWPAYGDYATLGYTNEKVRENYSRRFRITFPNEFLPMGRDVQTSPIHDRMAARNAVFGDGFGLEAPLWFQAPRARSRWKR